MYQTPEHDKLDVADELAYARDTTVGRAEEKLAYAIGIVPERRPDPVDQYLNYGKFEPQDHQPVITVDVAKAQVDATAFGGADIETRREQQADVMGGAQYV